MDSLKGISNWPKPMLEFDLGVFNISTNSIKNLQKATNNILSSILPISKLISQQTDIQKTITPLLNRLTISQLNVQTSILPIIDSMSSILNGLDLSQLTKISDMLLSVNSFYGFSTIIKPSENKKEITNESIVQELAQSSRHVAFNQEATIRQKRNWFKSLIEGLFKIFESTKLSNLLAIISILISLYSISIPPNQVIIKETMREIIYIQESESEIVNDKPDLRVIIKNTFIYSSKKAKTRVYLLEIGDIVEVLNIKKDMIKVKLYDNDMIGWVRKKYTKSPK